MVTPNLKTKLKNSFRQMTTERTPHQPLPENIRHVTTFLRKIRTHFPISLIYYPGCGGDQILEKAFKPWEIIYVDKDANRSRYGSRLKANYRHPPFRDETFDALFYRDIHAEVEEFNQLLRVLKTGGVFIFCRDIPCSFDKEDRLKDVPNLSPLSLPFVHPEFGIYQKTHHIDQEYRDPGEQVLVQIAQRKPLLRRIIGKFL